MDPVPLKLFHLPQRHVEAVAPFNQHPTAAQWKERCAGLRSMMSRLFALDHFLINPAGKNCETDGKRGKPMKPARD